MRLARCVGSHPHERRLPSRLTTRHRCLRLEPPTLSAPSPWCAWRARACVLGRRQGRDQIIDAYLDDKYLQAIQINAPWLLRYLTTAIIINKRRRDKLRGLVKVIQQEQYAYSDPITKFLECLRVEFDFEGAQQRLHECTQVLKSDYFLCNCTDEFVKAARFFIFETYCRIHQKIDMAGLAAKLMMAPEDAELWIVNLIRGAQLDAKIDSKAGCVVMGSHFPSVYQQVII